MTIENKICVLCFFIICLIFGCSVNEKDEKKEKITTKFQDTIPFANNEAEEYFQKGYNCSKEKKYSDAIDFYKKSLEYDADQLVTLLNLGNAYSDIGNFESSEDCYLKIIELNPNYFPVYINYSDLFMTKKQYEKAIDIAQTGLVKTKDEKGRASLYFNIAVSYGNLDECEKAWYYFDLLKKSQGGILRESDINFKNYLEKRCGKNGII